MATFTVTPPVDCGRSLTGPRVSKTGRRQTTRTIAGVTLTQTDIGYTAQGLHIDLIEDTPPYWTVVLPDGGQRSERTLTRLVTRLAKAGHLIPGTAA